MARLPRRFRGALALVVMAAIGGGALGGTFGAFTSTTSNPGNNVTAAADFRAPTMSCLRDLAHRHRHARATSAGRLLPRLRERLRHGQPGERRVTVTANVSQVTTGQTAVTLTAGSFTVGGVSYNYRSASLTANAALSEGSKPYSVTATDGASNSGTRSDLSVTVDNTAPTASDVQAQNNGSTVGPRAAGRHDDPHLQRADRAQLGALRLERQLHERRGADGQRRPARPRRRRLPGLRLAATTQPCRSAGSTSSAPTT